MPGCWAGSCRCCLAVCTELSQDTPQQLKPPETQAGGGRAVTLGTVPAAQGPRKRGWPRGCETVTSLALCCRRWVRGSAPQVPPGRLKTSAPASGRFVLRGFYRNEKGVHDDPPKNLLSPRPALGAMGVSEPTGTGGLQPCRTQQGLQRGWILAERWETSSPCSDPKRVQVLPANSPSSVSRFVKQIKASPAQ